MEEYLETSPKSPKRHNNYQSSVDTSSPFRSVKEAVAIFGERILAGSAYTSPAAREITTYDNSSCSHVEKTTPKYKNDIMETLKKVEAELEETKAELKVLREREKETTWRLAEAEAAMEAEERERELRKRMEKNTTLAHILNLGLGENDISNMSDHFGTKKKKVKPIVPLLGDFFPWKKKSANSTSSSLHDSMYKSSHLYNSY